MMTLIVKAEPLMGFGGRELIGRTKHFWTYLEIRKSHPVWSPHKTRKKETIYSFSDWLRQIASPNRP